MDEGRTVIELRDLRPTHGRRTVPAVFLVRWWIFGTVATSVDRHPVDADAAGTSVGRQIGTPPTRMHAMK
ncbi:hypothetical protein [Lysobacter terrae]